MSTAHIAEAKPTPNAAALSATIGNQLDGIYDVQALLEAAQALTDGGGAVSRLLTMANGRLDAVCDALDLLELNSAEVSK